MLKKSNKKTNKTDLHMYCKNDEKNPVFGLKYLILVSKIIGNYRKYHFNYKYGNFLDMQPLHSL